MSKITKMKYSLQKKAGQAIVEEAIKRLETAIELKDQGRYIMIVIRLLG